MRGKCCVLRVAALLGLWLPSVQAGAATITLSNASSDEAAIAAAEMSATLDFAVSGNTLTLSVDNLASGLRMVDFYFNVSDDVTSITLTSGPSHTSTGAPLWALSSGAATSSFGIFDYALTGITAGAGPNKQTGAIAAGSSASFVFALTGSSLDAGDFGAEVNAAHVKGAATFRVGNNGGIAAMGAEVTAPEPTTAALLALGLGLLARVGRRRGSA